MVKWNIFTIFLVKIVPPGLEIGHLLVEMAPPGLGNLCQVLHSGMVVQEIKETFTFKVKIIEN